MQLGILIPLSLLALLSSKTLALSTLLGGLLCVLPHAYFASYAFRHMGARASAQIARAFYRGESGKFVLTLVGFASVFTLVKPLNAPALFIAYLIMLLVQWWMTAKVIGNHSSS